MGEVGGGVPVGAAGILGAARDHDWSAAEGVASCLEHSVLLYFSLKTSTTVPSTTILPLPLQSTPLAFSLLPSAFSSDPHCALFCVLAPPSPASVIVRIRNIRSKERPTKKKKKKMTDFCAYTAGPYRGFNDGGQGSIFADGGGGGRGKAPSSKISPLQLAPLKYLLSN